MNEVGINVVYQNKVWRTSGLMLRENLFNDLKFSNPNKMVKIKRNGRLLRVPISRLVTVSNHRL